jgi:hypothetical protein
LVRVADQHRPPSVFLAGQENRISGLLVVDRQGVEHHTSPRAAQIMDEALGGPGQHLYSGHESQSSYRPDDGSVSFPE